MEEIPLEQVHSFAPLVILDKAGEMISEHESTPEAVQALARHARLSYEGPAIYRKGKQAWVKY